MKYCGIKRQPSRLAVTNCSNKFNKDDEPYQSLGDKLIASIEYGSDVGSPSVVQYDPSDVEDVDVLTSPDHDFFDIAEEFGAKVEKPAPPIHEDEQE